MFEKMKKFLQTHPPITKAIIFFHSLFAQHVSTLHILGPLGTTATKSMKKGEFFS
jgi:hypothetical protein